MNKFGYNKNKFQSCYTMTNIVWPADSVATSSA